MSAVATHCGRNRARSAMPPEMMAGTAAANVHRKKNLTSVRPCGPKPSCRAAAEALGVDEESHAVGDRVADEEVGDGRDREIDEDLAERIDLVLVAYGADFEKREAAMHGEDENCAYQQKQHVSAALQSLNGRLNSGMPQPPRFHMPIH